jgi:hypothetical protein
MGDPASSHLVAPGHCRSGGVEGAATSGGLNRGFHRFCSCLVWPAWQPADPLCRGVLHVAPKASRRGCCSCVGYRKSELAHAVRRHQSAPPTTEMVGLRGAGHPAGDHCRCCCGGSRRRLKRRAVAPRWTGTKGADQQVLRGHLEWMLEPSQSTTAAGRRCESRGTEPCLNQRITD